MLPATLGGEKVKWIVLDDASDTTRAVTNTRKFISEDKVDVILGSTVTPNSLAMIDVAADGETPMISMAASARIVDPTNPKTRWVFKVPQNDSLMADAIAIHMKANGVKTLGYIGFNDAYGESWLGEIKRSAQTAGIKVVADEKYNRNDASVTGQVLKLVAANPDAILIGASGTPARDAAEGARRAPLQGQDLPDARRRQSRFPARMRRRLQRHVAADRADARVRAAARYRIRSRKSRRSTSRNTKRSTARIPARRSAAMPTIRSCCCPRRSPKR